MNLNVIFALTRRYLYLYTRNPVRMIELIFWPSVELLVMGFLTVFIQKSSGSDFGSFIRFLLGAVIFWDVLFRSQQAVAISFLEDVWTRNLLNIFVAPVRTYEYLFATFCVGLLRVGLTVFILTLLAWLVYAFNLFEFEWSLIPYFANLMIFGWSLGMISTALILRWGQAAEGLAWAVPYLLQPFSAVFYPVSILPTVFQFIAWLLPSTYVFEGMRAGLAEGSMNYTYFWLSVLANLVFMVISGLIFAQTMKAARQKGLLTRIATQ